jgi:hypothetical protein
MIVMTLLVRDESDIISANIDFHLKVGVDFFIATDNRSSDNTAEILHYYERQGVLHYIYEDDDNYAQHEWVTRMARLAANRYGADWVINNDADEFWWPERDNLQVVLDALDSEIAAVAVSRTNFLPVATKEKGFFVSAMTLRETVSLNAVGRTLPPKVCHRAHPDIEVDQGNHCVRLGGKVISVAPAPISILHFPLRSYEQFENKISKGGAAYARNAYLPIEVGSTWRYLYDLWRRGELRAYYDRSIPSADEIREGLESGRYVRDDRLKRFFDDHRRVGRLDTDLVSP